MAEPSYSVLFICTGNSARSIMAEAILNHLGRGRFNAYSAGTNPRGTVHPMTLVVLTESRYPVQNLRSKSWEEFAISDATPMDFIFTVCNQAAGETCPAWPGQPITAHWDFVDPASVMGEYAEQRRASCSPSIRSQPGYASVSACRSTSSTISRYKASYAG